MRHLFLFFFISSLVGCAAPEHRTFSKYDHAEIQLPPGESLYIKAQSQKDVSYHGQYDYDDVDLGGNAMMYPGDTGALFVTSVLAHAVTMNSIRNNAMAKVQEDADTVLDPYQKYIEEFETGELLASVVHGLNEHYNFSISTYAESLQQVGYVMISEPVFFMTQDQRELILRHAMYVHPVGQSDQILHKNFVEVSSARFEQDSPQVHWIDNNNLAITSARLYALSIELFIDDVLNRHHDQERAPKTFRYILGGEKLYERGTLVTRRCGKTTIRTLRGWLKSFPDANAVSTESSDCGLQDYVDSAILTRQSRSKSYESIERNRPYSESGRSIQIQSLP